MRLSEAEMLALVADELGDLELEDDPGDFTEDDVHVRLRNDNVIVRLLGRPALTDSGLALARPAKVPCTNCVRKGNGKCPLCRGSTLMKNPNLEPLVEAEVLAVGPGYYTSAGAFVPQELAIGDIVLVADDAGDKYRYRQDVRVIRSGGLWEGGTFLPGEVWGVVETSGVESAARPREES